MAYIDYLETHGILPTFFPADLPLEMNSPVDLAKFITRIIATESFTPGKKILELVGPRKYSSQEVAETFSEVLHKKVTVQSIPKEQWQQTLTSAGFTENTSANLTAMTQAVIDQGIVPEISDQAIKLCTTLKQYLKEQLPGK